MRQMKMVEAESREVRPPDRCQVLPWKISVRGGACAIAAGDAPSGAPLTVIFARRENVRRGEGGPVSLAGAVTVGALERVPAAYGCGGSRPEAAPRPVGFRP
jgi:hypothetical protein